MAKSLSRTTVGLHWAVAACVVAMLVFGLYIGGLPRGAAKTELIQSHKSFGVLLLVLLLARLGWRWLEGWPPPARRLGRWEALVSRAVHWLLLLGPIVMVLSGLVRSLAYARPVKVFDWPFLPRLLETKHDGLNEMAGAVHDAMAVAILIGVIMHAGGALKHSLIDRDDTLPRMLGWPGLRR